MQNYNSIKFCERNNGINFNLRKSNSNNSLLNSLTNEVTKKENISNLNFKKSNSESHLDFICYISNLIERLENTKYQKNIKFKEVNFNEKVKIVYIPTKEEYKLVGLNKVLWFTSEEFKKFKSEYEYRIRNNFESKVTYRMDTRSPTTFPTSHLK